MRSAVRVKLDMVDAVRQFSRDHPSDDPSYGIMIGKLDEGATRAKALVRQEAGGRIAELAAITRRDELRLQVHFQLLRHLIRTAQLAAKERPELLRVFRILSLKAPHQSYLVASQRMLEAGVADKDFLASYGLSTAMLAELGGSIAEYETASNDARTGKVAHVGARAELEGLVAELLDRVEQLNTFNQRRFRDEMESLAAWENVRSVFGPKRSKPQPLPTGDGSTPPAGRVAPAA